MNGPWSCLTGTKLSSYLLPMNIQYANLPEENSRIRLLCLLFLARSSFFVLDLFHDLAHFWNGALELGNCLARSLGLDLLKLGNKVKNLVLLSLSFFAMVCKTWCILIVFFVLKFGRL